MKIRIALLVGLVLATTPVSASAQEAGSPPPSTVDMALVNQLCAAGAADEAELNACVGAVEAALLELAEAPPEELGLLEQAQAIVDDTIEGIAAIDVEAALEDVIAGAQDFELDVDIDVQGAIDDAVAAFEDVDLPTDIDVQAAIESAVAEALAATGDLDLQAAVDDALAEAQAAIEEADLGGTVDEAVSALQGSVEDARAVVAEAQRWAQENRDAVCRGGSISLGTTVGVAVFVLTGVEWLGLQAFWATERFTNAVCGDLAG